MEIIKNNENEIIQEVARQNIRECYDLIMQVLKYYMDLKEEYYNLITLWIIGTYFHKQFNTYPVLFINAMKGSGKTRLENLIKNLSLNGEVILSLTEAVFFRSNNDTTMIIDEFESLASKEKATLRELLNACYKKGNKVKRMRKTKTVEGEKQVIEEFEIYRPLVLANINGIEEVLSDRSISIYLEKSSNYEKTLLLEDFEENPIIKDIKTKLNPDLCSVCSVVYILGNIQTLWNNYVTSYYKRDNYTSIHILHNTTQHNTTTPLELKTERMFNYILSSNINGRHLELFFPIFLIANIIGEHNLKETISFSQEIINEKKTDEMAESKDVLLLQFISRLDRFQEYRIKELNIQFKDFIQGDYKEVEEINTKWLGIALKRLSLITHKERDHSGIKVMLDIDKAAKKCLLFKTKEELDEVLK